MKSILRSLLLLLTTGITTTEVLAQASACPTVNAGTDQTICGGCTNLTATIQGSVGTGTYAVSSIPYNPYPYTTGTSVLINIDDTWSSAIPLPFCFDFFGSTYSSIVIGSNGIVSFNTALAGGYCEWQITTPAPSTSAEDCILAPYQDIDPSVTAFSSPTVKYMTYGAAPCREFVVSWANVSMYDPSGTGGCNTLIATSQVVMHETTNIIDIYIQNKPLCTSWNGGAAIEGIVNPSGTTAYIVPGRNYPTQWTASNDGQRIMPTGAPNYTLTWTGPSGSLGSSNTINVCPTTTTTYTATIVNTSCSGPITLSDQVVVNVNPGFSVAATSTPSQCTSNNGTATATPGGGTGPFTYSWSPSGGTGATATGLAPGIYTVTVTDAGGCSGTQTVQVTSSGGTTASLSSQQNVSCNNGNNGSATVAGSGGTAPYTYSWSPSGGNSATATNLAAGTYTCTVTDANGCTGQQIVTITQPPVLMASASSTDVLCNGGSTGSATATPAGGSPGYTYAWLPSGGNNATANNLAAGNYTCTITDLNGCTTTASVAITQPLALQITPTQTNVGCNGGNNGSATATASGGTGALTYAWAPTGGNAATASNLAAGTYTCTVTDANGCSTTQSFTITQPAVLSAAATAVPAGCSSNTGSATATPSGGTGPYTYSWAPSGGNSATASNLAAGSYTCTITDANGCTTTASATVTQSSPMSVTPLAVNATCNGVCNASASVTPSGGTPPYSYSWSPSGGNAATASNLCPGTYTCAITDNAGCNATQQVTVSQPTAITIAPVQQNILCNGGNNGSATVAASGGTGGYTYAWAPSGGSNGTANNLSSGTYTCTVTDANGCTQTQTFNITQPQPLTLAANGDSICPGTNGSISVIPGGGTSPYTVSWTNSLPNGPSQTVSPATTTTYTATVTDGNGCTTSVPVTAVVNQNPLAIINGPSLLPFTPPATQVCFTDGSAGAVAWGWLLDNGSTSTQQNPCFSVSDTGIYCAYMVITDSHGCYDTATQCLRVTEAHYSIPNVFTPNADGTNDAFVITNSGMSGLHCVIYDRWGIKVYEWDGTTGSWDGTTLNGKKAVDGTYYWIADLTDLVGTATHLSGFVELITGP